MKKLYRYWLSQWWGLVFANSMIDNYNKKDNLKYFIGFLAALNYNGRRLPYGYSKPNIVAKQLLEQDYITALDLLARLIEKHKADDVFFGTYTFILGLMPTVAHSKESAEYFITYLNYIHRQSSYIIYAENLGLSNDEIQTIDKFINILEYIYTYRDSLDIILDWAKIETFISVNPFMLSDT